LGSDAKGGKVQKDKYGKGYSPVDLFWEHNAKDRSKMPDFISQAKITD
jgi:hypothetical protein